MREAQIPNIGGGCKLDGAFLDALEKPKPRVRHGKARKGAPSERVVQRQIIKAGRGMGLRLVHIPNGVKYVGDGLARARQAAVLRADGLVPGFPDLLCIKPGGAGVGFLEVKREGGIVSEDQQRCIAHMQADGCRVAVVCTLAEALAAWQKWGWL